MIVNFIKLKRRLDRFAYGHLKGIHVRDGSFLNLMARHIIHEGHTTTYQTVENETMDLNMEKIESVITIPRSDLHKLRFQEVIDLYEKMSTELLNKKFALSYKRINEVVESSGNVIDGSGKSFSESTLEMLEKIHIEFDDIRERPQLPTMVVNPVTGEKLRKEEEQMSPEEKEEHARKQSQILDRKYEEYVLRESNRKLVD
jgi:hypothetical protein